MNQNNAAHPGTIPSNVFFLILIKVIASVSKVLMIIHPKNTTHHTFDKATVIGWNAAQEAKFTALGAIACTTVLSRYPGLESTAQDPTISQAERDAITVPIFEISDIDYHGLEALTQENPNSNVVIWIGPNEGQYFDYWYGPGGILLSLIPSLFNAAAVFSAILSLVSFVRLRCTLNIAMVCVLFHIIASTSTLPFDSTCGPFVPDLFGVIVSPPFFQRGFFGLFYSFRPN